MLIDLFNDPVLHTKTSQPLGYMSDRKCEIIEDLSFYKNMDPISLDEHFHVKSVLENMDKPRRYMSILGDITDSHNEIEKLGVCKHRKRYTTIISMEDSLDYLLHRICSARIDNIRIIDKYKELSRALLKLNFDALDGKFDLFTKADNNLNDFINTLYNSLESKDESDRSNQFILEFTKKILGELFKVLEYVSFTYMFSLDKGVAVLRSKSLCSFVLTSSEKLEDELVLKSEGFDDYRLKVRSFESMEYLERINLEYA